MTTPDGGPALESLLVWVKNELSEAEAWANRSMYPEADADASGRVSVWESVESEIEDRIKAREAKHD